MKAIHICQPKKYDDGGNKVYKLNHTALNKLEWNMELRIEDAQAKNNRQLTHSFENNGLRIQHDSK